MMQSTSPLANKNYDLVSILYHASQGCECCSQYMQDAQQENDSEVAQFMREAQEQNRRLAEKASELLKKRL